MNLELKISPPNLLIDWGNFEHWVDGASAAPTGYTLTGGGAVARESTEVKYGTYSAKLTYSGSATSIYRDLQDQLDRKIPSQPYTGRHFKYGAYVKCSTASCARIAIDDGVGTSYSSYHTGDGTWQFLTVERDFDESATRLRASCNVEISGVAYFDGSILCEGEELFTNLDADGNINVGRLRYSDSISLNLHGSPNRPGKSVIDQIRTGKRVTLSGSIKGDTAEAARDLLDQVKKAFSDGPKNIYYYNDRYLNIVVKGFNDESIAAGRFIKWSVVVEVDGIPGSQKYNANRHKEVITATTTFSVTNNGNADVRPIIRVKAIGTDVTTLSLKNFTNGHVFSYTGTITAGDELIVDTLQLMIWNDGVRDLDNFSNGDFLRLVAGANKLKYTGSNCTLEIDYVERYL